MMRGLLVDTNVFLRLLTQDDRARARAAQEVVEDAIGGRVQLYVTVAVILEMVWTLESYYSLGRAEVAEKLSLLLNTPHLGVENRDVVEQALEHYSGTKADFADCYNAAYAVLQGEGGVLSFDRHFDRIPGVTRVDPSHRARRHR